MRLPDDPFEFVDPQKPDFRIAGWESIFGRYNWFYVVGGRGLLTKAKISDLSDAATSLDKLEIPSSWKSVYESGFDWDSCASNQVFRSLNGKAQRFDKALMCILAIVQTVKAKGAPEFLKKSGSDKATDFIRLKPATFEIVGFDQNRLKGLDSSQRLAILAKARQRKPNVLEEIARGHGATFPTLDAITKEVDKAPVEPKVSRTYKRLKPAPSETIL